VVPGLFPLYVPVQAWLPMLYDLRWAYGDIINWVWLMFVVAAALMGALCSRRSVAVWRAGRRGRRGADDGRTWPDPDAKTRNG
jgi:hypothetical protein